jgi:Fe-only nitrogenase accessory protein AnfO
VKVLAKEIAVHIGYDGATVSLYESGTVAVLQKKQGTWQVVREQEFVLNKEGGMRDLRKQIGELLNFLGECKTFVASSVTGVPYYELERAEHSVWEFSGKPSEFLDYVWEKEAAARQQSQEIKRQVTMPVPVETGNGCYSISIKEIQESDAGITSKQVLLPFLRQGKFYQLEVRCNHIPPWLEAEALTGNLACISEKLGHNEFRFVVNKKVCGS